MKVVIIVGGFGTRLTRDIERDEAGTYKHLINIPKSLLPVDGIPLLSHWMKIFEKSESIDAVYVGTNKVFYKQFEEWALDWPEFVSVVSDGKETNETRLGSVATIAFVTNHYKIVDDNVLVLAGDTLFYEDFDLAHMIDRFNILKSTCSDCSLVTVYECAEKDVSNHGILEVDEKENRVISFLEKPSPAMTTSRLACPCFYMLSSQAVQEVSKFLKLKEEAPLQEKDASGLFLNYLYKRLPMFTYKISGRFDVGGLASYIACIDHFGKKKK